MGVFDFFSSPASAAAPSPPPPAPAASSSPPPDTSNKHVTPLNPKGIKPCCACPETKVPRDDCFLKYGHEGEESWRCKDLVEEHRKCMASLGFKI